MLQKLRLSVLLTCSLIISVSYLFGSFWFWPTLDSVSKLVLASAIIPSLNFFLVRGNHPEGLSLSLVSLMFILAVIVKYEAMVRIDDFLVLLLINAWWVIEYLIILRSEYEE